MQQRIAVVTDSSSDLAPEVAVVHGITVVPLTIHFGDTDYKDGIDLTPAGFMERMEATEKLPTTSHPSAGAFERVFRELAADHDEILCLTISSRLSGAWESANLAAEAVAGEVKVTVIDSLAVSAALGFQVLRAASLAEEGQDAASIQTTLAAEADRYQTAYFVEELDHLRRGGRIGKAAQMLGTMLQLRPLLRMEEGQIVPYERTRTRARAMATLIDFVQEAAEIERAAVIHTSQPEEAETLAASIADMTGLKTVVTVQVGPVIAAHVGPGMLGVSLKEVRDA